MPSTELSSLPFARDRFEADFQHLQALNPQVQSPDLHVYDSIPSTNQMAWDLLNAAPSEGLAVLALEQTAGRGQWSREWVSCRGGLYLSVGLLPDLDPANSAQLTIATAWGIATALRHLPFPVQLKWPNDLVLQGRKLGGILSETRIQQGRIAKAVVGVGLNWVNPVPDPGISLSQYMSLSQSSPVPATPVPAPDQGASQATKTELATDAVPNRALASLESLAALTLYGVMSGYQRWKHSGIESILPEYWNLLTHRDRPIEHQGQRLQLVGVTAAGELRVKSLEPSAQVGLAPGLTPMAAEQRLKPGTINLGYESLRAD